jgi:hypothetical protein
MRHLDQPGIEVANTFGCHEIALLDASCRFSAAVPPSSRASLAVPAALSANLLPWSLLTSASRCFQLSIIGAPPLAFA